MSNPLEQEIKVIKKNDPLFPPQFQFETLRRKGLDYLGKLSGKLWTDHNVHDPGITMLEMLCYALMDLHYRTQLPIGDLLAPGDEARPEDNFFTPAQILSCNPTTITDFRKALIDVYGVRNAWLEIAEDGEIPLAVDCNPNEEGIPQSRIECLNPNDPAQGRKHPVKLNGLYKVYIEPDKDNPYCTEGSSEIFDYKGLVARVWEALHKYRNLCEDFLSVEVLCEESIAVCLEIDVEDGLSPDKIYLDVLHALDRFLSPRIQFFTLQELLEKGSTIEEAFEGRPYEQESYGFIDTEALENMERIKEIHLSDLYTVINQVPGVQSVEKLQVKGFYPNGDEHIPPATECGSWIFQLARNHVPRLCFDRSCITLYKGSSRLKVDLGKLKKLFGETLAAYQRIPYDLASGYLDFPIEYGGHRSDLAEYYSIQNEFPKVYGIEEGGLSPEVSDLRKAQARQLKGYLLFYDQLLAGYLSQLSHLRSLFSMSPDYRPPRRLPEDRHTYFNQSLDTVPDVHLLLHFYTESFATTFGWSEGTAVIMPLAESTLDQPFEQLLSNPYYYGTVSQRDAAVQQFIRAFEQGEMTTEIKEDPCGYYFLLRLSFSEVVLNSRKLYETEDLARQAANMLAFLSMMEDKYQLINLPAQKKYSFELIYGPVSFKELLQQSLESEMQYLRRRNGFLDHLLARFSESFADYALLLYENVDLTTSKRIVRDKAEFLSEYDSISRNRGKAYNYQLNNWNTGNVSGLEKKMSAITGISNAYRHDLCTFEVVQYAEEYGFEVRGLGNDLLFSSTDKYGSEEKAAEAAKTFLQALRKSEGYSGYDRPEKNEYGLEFRYQGGVALHPVVYASAQQRDDKMMSIQSLFGDVAAEDNLVVTRYAYRNELLNAEGEAVVRSKKKYTQTDKAREASPDFAKKIERQDIVKSLGTSLELRATKDENRWINREALISLFSVDGPGYRWEIIGPAWLPLLSQTVFGNQEEALEGFISFTDKKRDDLSIEVSTHNGRSLYRVLDEKNQTLAWGDTTTRAQVSNIWKEYLTQRFSANWMFEQVNEAWQWELTDHGKTLLKSEMFFRNRRMAEKSWRELKDFRSKKEKTNVVIEERENQYFIHLTDIEGRILARSTPYDKKPESAVVDRISILLGDEENGSYAKVEGAIGFHLPSLEEEGHDVLLSYSVYPTKMLAYKALQKTLAAGGRKAGYFKSGDDANLNFSFLLYDNTHRFIATHPETYTTEEDRDEALEHVVSMLKKYPPFVDTQEEYSYTFHNHKGEVWCRSERSFSSPEEAYAHADRWITMGVSKEHYRPTTHEGRTRYGFIITDGDEVLARNTTDFWSEAMRDEQLKAFIGLFESNTFEIQPATLPDRWKIRYFWPSGILLESVVEYKSEEEAREAYTALTGQLDKLKTVATEKGIEFMLPVSEEAVGVYPYTLADEGIREKTLKEIGHFLDTVKALRRSTGQSYKQFVYKASEYQGGTWAYQVLKKESALAYHPGFCLEQEDTEAIRQQINKLFQQAEKGYQFLELCLGGNICLEIENKVHYLLRDKYNHTIYFISYQGYDTEQEAVSAFAANYLFILAKACDADNYGPCKSIVYELPSNPPYCPEDPLPCAFVPETTREKFTNEELARLVCTYPIVVNKIATDKTDCRNWKVSYCYGFKLVTYIDNELHCDWKSTECYETAEQASAAFELFLILLKNKINITTQWDAEGIGSSDMDCCCPTDREKCCYRLVLKEVLLESICRYAEPADAWKGLDKLLEEVCIDSAFYPYWDNELCCYSFFVTGRDFHVARHPYAYHTPEERDAAIDALFAQCRCPDERDIQIEITETENCPQAPYLFIITEGNTVVWRSTKSFGTRKEAIKVGVQAMQYATENDFYLRTAQNTWLFNKRGQHSPKENQAALLAIHPGNTLEVSELISKARNYPVVTKGDSYGFALYCNAFEVIEEAPTPSKCDPVDTPGEPIHKYGAIVWKSIKSYATPEEAEQAYQRFCELLDDKKNYRPETSDTCGPYYIELVDMNPRCGEENDNDTPYDNEQPRRFSTLLAHHPQCYPKSHLLNESLERTKACLKNEGMHLVEHILLRPRQQEDCGCLLPAFPDCDCELKFEAPIPDPCLLPEMDECDEVPTAPMEYYYPNADPYSFVATLVLPCWTKRFRRHDFRQAFETLLLREAPAHVYFKVFWITPEQMCRFEKAYKNWIQWISGKNSCGVHNHLCEMIEILSTLEDCLPDLDTPDTPDCICKEDNVRFNRGLLFSKYINTMQWPIVSSLDTFKKALFGVGNITILPKIDFGKIFIPRLIGTLPNVGVPSVETQPALSEEEIAKRVRQRLAAYKIDLEKVGDARFRKTENFKRTEFFLSSEGQPEQYTSLIHKIAEGIRKSKSEKNQERYVQLVRQATAYLLDHAVLAEMENTLQPVVEALKKANEQLKKEGLKASEWLQTWDPTDWKTWFSSKAAADYFKKVK